MSTRPFRTRNGRFGLVLLMVLGMQPLNTLAAQVSVDDEAGILPIKTSNVNRYDTIDSLLTDMSKSKKAKSKTFNKDLQDDISQNDFKCHLFENSPLSEVLISADSLAKATAALSGPACSGNGSANANEVVVGAQKISKAITELQNLLNHPRQFRDNNEKLPDDKNLKLKEKNSLREDLIASKINQAILATNSVSDSLNQIYNSSSVETIVSSKCRKSLNAGQIVSAVNDIVNGLTPLALKIAAGTGSGSVAVPFIVGANVGMNSVATITKIVSDSSVDMNVSANRRAVVESTCQYVRMDQKYKYLLKSHSDQISQLDKIKNELIVSQQLYSAKASVESNTLVNDSLNIANIKEAVSENSKEMNQLESDKLFLDNSDKVTICMFGIKTATMINDDSNYAGRILKALDQAQIVSGSNNNTQVETLKASGAIAIKNLKSAASKVSSGKVNYEACAENARSLVKILDQSAQVANEMFYLKEESAPANQARAKALGLYSTAEAKRDQVENLQQSLGVLQDYANNFTQSEIDSEMAKIRFDLFEGSVKSPLVKWFDYVNGLHKDQFDNFIKGLKSLRDRSLRLTKSGAQPKLFLPYMGGTPSNSPSKEDLKTSFNLENFNLKVVKMATPEHQNICRELGDVVNHMVTALHHLSASNSLCNMIEPYIFDNRSEDKYLVQMCRGKFLKANKIKTDSTLMTMKRNLIVNHAKEWLELLERRRAALACVDR